MLVADQIHHVLDGVFTDFLHSSAGYPQIECVISTKAQGEIDAYLLDKILRQSWNRRNTIVIMVRDNGNGEAQLSLSVQGSQILHYTEIVRN